MSDMSQITLKFLRVETFEGAVPQATFQVTAPPDKYAGAPKVFEVTLEQGEWITVAREFRVDMNGATRVRETSPDR